MTENPISVQPLDDIDYSVEVLLQQKFHILPVVNDNNEPVGVLTALDLLKGLYQPKTKEN